MTRIYRCQQGDVLDNICFNELGSEHYVVNLLGINPRLASAPAVLPLGTEVILPDVPTQSVQIIDTVRLWD